MRLAREQVRAAINDSAMSSDKPTYPSTFHTSQSIFRRDKHKITTPQEISRGGQDLSCRSNYEKGV